MEIPNFFELMRTPKYNTLKSELVYDNAQGNASKKENKSSIWVLSDNIILRIANISTTYINGVDDIHINERLILWILCAVPIKNVVMHMNRSVLSQLTMTRLVRIREGKYFFMGDVECFIDCGISANEKTLI